MEKKYFVVVTEPSDKENFLGITVKAKSPADAARKARKSIAAKYSRIFTHFRVFNHYSDHFKGVQPLLDIKD